MMNIIAKIGDLFSIPLDSKSFGLGVVAGKWNDELYLVLFKEIFDDSELASKVQLNELAPILASSSLDAKLWHGHWPIIRHDVDISMIKQPIYKVNEPSGIVAESFDRKFRRLVNFDDSKHLNFRKTVAPIRLENALLAYHGLGQPNPAYDELSYANVLISN